MIRGIFTSASGMKVMQSRLDIISNNLANVDKTGYKKDIAIMKAFPDIQVRRQMDDGLVVFPEEFSNATMAAVNNAFYMQNKMYINDLINQSILRSSMSFFASSSFSID